MPTGKVRSFSKSRNFGFIAQDDGRDVFVHSSALREHGIHTLSEGDPVAFDIVLENGRMKAVGVRLMTEAAR